jgi:hypothetical protein
VRVALAVMPLEQMVLILFFQLSPQRAVVVVDRVTL